VVLAVCDDEVGGNPVCGAVRNGGNTHDVTLLATADTAGARLRNRIGTPDSRATAILTPQRLASRHSEATGPSV